MFDLTSFSLRDMVDCTTVLRTLGKEAKSMEEVAEKLVRYLYEHLIDVRSGEKVCGLVRFFKTHPLSQLETELGAHAQRLLGSQACDPQMPCLTLLATAGEKSEWNNRAASVGHKAIPLASEKAIEAAPMISNLIKQLGLDVKTILQPDPRLLLDVSQRMFNVFHVSEAVNSPYIPAQQEFVIPCRIKSVMGFGGVLPLGSLFVVILFSKQCIPLATAEMFKPLALSVKLAVLPFEELVFRSGSMG